MKCHARIAPGKPIDNGRYETRGQQGGASDPNFSGSRVSEKLDIPHRLAQVIEHGRSTIEQGATIHGRFDPPGCALDQTHTNDVFQFRSRARWEPDWIDPRFWFLGNDGTV